MTSEDTLLGITLLCLVIHTVSIVSGMPHPAFDFIGFKLVAASAGMFFGFAKL